MRGAGEKAFIATQAPVEYTIEKFWQMVWENKCKLIVMLCPCMGPKKVNKLRITYRKKPFNIGVMPAMERKSLETKPFHSPSLVCGL